MHVFVSARIYRVIRFVMLQGGSKYFSRVKLTEDGLASVCISPAPSLPDDAQHLQKSFSTYDAEKMCEEFAEKFAEESILSISGELRVSPSAQDDDDCAWSEEDLQVAVEMLLKPAPREVTSRTSQAADHDDCASNSSSCRGICNRLLFPQLINSISTYPMQNNTQKEHCLFCNY